MTRSPLLHIANAIALALTVSVACAQPAAKTARYPDRPVRVIVPTPAGGSQDVIMRAILTKLSDTLGKSFVVDNRSGAGGADRLVEPGADLGIGLLAPKATPKTVVNTLYATLVKAVNDPTTSKRMEKAGGDPETMQPAEFVKFMNEEWQRFGQAIKIANLKPE